MSNKPISDVVRELHLNEIAEVARLKALNSDLLAALKLLHAWQHRLTLTAAVTRAAKGQLPTDSDTAEIGEWATATADAGLAIKAAEKQSAGEQS